MPERDEDHSHYREFDETEVPMDNVVPKGTARSHREAPLDRHPPNKALPALDPLLLLRRQVALGP
jgi:hypothetical protein